jgi:tetratricopeptide (TPR) repeat protein
VAEGVSEGGGSHVFRGDGVRTVVQAHSIGNLTINAPQPGAPGALPPAVDQFVDRAESLARLDGLASVERRPGSPGLALLPGLSGIGKTATALHWAHGARDRFPDGQLYFDFGGGTGRREAVGPGEALGVFLRVLGVPTEDVKGGYAGLRSLFHDRVNGRRLLVVLDNVRLPTQVRDLLPPSAHSVVIVTTDRDLSALAGTDGAEVVPLGELPEEEGVRLLTLLVGERRVAAEPAAARELVRLCGNWPLNVRIAAGRLKARPTRRIARVVAQIRAAREGLAEGAWMTQVVSDGAYADLPDDLRRAYRLLSLHPGHAGVSFTAGAAAALLDAGEAEGSVGEEETLDLLDRLLDVHLLQERDDRYVFHDLVLAHARARAESEEEPDERERAVRRVLEWYLAFASAADRAVNRHRPVFGRQYESLPATSFDSVAAGLAWLEAEHRNLRAAVFAAADRRLDDLTWRLCEALWGLYFSHKHYDDWIATHRTGLEAAERLGDPRARFRVAIQLGRALFETGSFAEARTILAAAREAAEETGDPLNQATALEFTGRTFEDEGRPADALPYILRARELEESGGRVRGVAINLHHLGRLRLALGEPGTALADLTTARDLFARIPDPYNEARVLSTLGRLHQRENRPDQARQSLGQALDLMRAEDRTYQVAEILTALADLSEDPAALRAEARAAYRRVGSPKADRL